MRKLFENSTSHFTVEQALEASESGIFLEVNDGKDINIVVDIEKEPTSSPAK